MSESPQSLRDAARPLPAGRYALWWALESRDAAQAAVQLRASGVSGDVCSPTVQQDRRAYLPPYTDRERALAFCTSCRIEGDSFIVKEGEDANAISGLFLQ